MLKKLFNSDNKFFLELDELKESEAVQTAVETTKKAASAAKETASDVADIAQDKLQSAIATEDKPAESKAKAKNKPAKPEAKDKVEANGKLAKSKAEDNSSKSEAKTEQNGSAKDSEVKTVGNTGASSYDPPFWVAAMYNDSSKEVNSNGKAAEQTFAPENLMPIATKYRRRPGGSLDKFKDMAKQAKTPK